MIRHALEKRAAEAVDRLFGVGSNLFAVRQDDETLETTLKVCLATPE